MRARGDDGDDLRREGRPRQESDPANGRPDDADSTAPADTRERLAWFPVFTGEMLSETRGWPLLARGAYYELLAAQWDLGVLPRDEAELRSHIRATSTEWRVAWRRLEGKFPTVGGGRQNAALEARRQRAHKLRDRQRAAAERTNASRWGNRAANGERVGERVGDRIASNTNITKNLVSTRERKEQGPPPVVDPGPDGARR